MIQHQFNIKHSEKILGVRLYILRGAEAYGENIFKNRFDIYAYISQRSPGLVGLALSWAGGVTERI